MKTTTILLGVAMACILGACKSEQKPKEEEIIVHKIELPKLSPPIRMQESVVNNNFDLGGKTLTSLITRCASDSLPIVKDVIGQEYIDNHVTLSIKNSAGETFYNRKFVKADFSKHLTPTFREEAILDGIAFDRAENDTAYFGVSVAIPQSDEFIPLVIKISKNANATIEIDSHGDEEVE